MRISHFLALPLICCLVSCSFKKDETPKAPEAATPAQTDVLKTIEREQERQASAGQLTNTNTRLEVLESDEPGIYKLLVHWPKDIKKIQITINNLEPTMRSFAEATAPYQMSVASGEVVKVGLQNFDIVGAPISFLTLYAQIPTDHIIIDRIQLTQHTKIEANRVFFQPGAQITTAGFKLDISANKVIFAEYPAAGASQYHQAHVLTTLPGNVIRTAQSSRESNISIHAKYGLGNLRVGMVGFNGHDGMSGSDQENVLNISRAVLPELNGTVGAAGVLRTRKMPCPKTKDGPVCADESTVCEKQPTNGTDGKPGKAGLTGKDGQEGGGTGSLSVMIGDSSKMSLSVIQKIGVGGKGGDGGEGFPGGAGGKAGAYPGAPCASAANGNPGAKGPKGPSGKNGIDGNYGSVITNVPKSEVIKI